MARNTSITQNLDNEVAQELEKALDFDLSSAEPTGEADIAASMEDLEAQISRAADELARESRNGTPAEPKADGTGTGKSEAKPEPLPNPMPMGLRPVDGPVTEKPPPANPLAQAQPAPAPVPPAAPAPAPAAFAPAHDDRQKDFRAAVGRMNRRPSTAIYWLMALLSIAWVAGGLWLAHLFYGAQ